VATAQEKSSDNLLLTYQASSVSTLPAFGLVELSFQTTYHRYPPKVNPLSKGMVSGITPLETQHRLIPTMQAHGGGLHPQFMTPMKRTLGPTATFISWPQARLMQLLRHPPRQEPPVVQPYITTIQSTILFPKRVTIVSPSFLSL
jgi:hypothetical protein